MRKHFDWSRALALLPVMLLGPWSNEARPLTPSPIWGPERFVRSAGRPSEVLFTFAVPDSTWRYKLQVVLDVDTAIAPMAKNLVASATITLNGAIAVPPSMFKKQAVEISRTITLQEQNLLQVRMNGSPGANLVITVYGPSVTRQIGPAGGSLLLEGIAQFKFPAGAFSIEAPIGIFVASDQETQELFDVSTVMYETGRASEYSLRLNTGKVLPDSAIKVSVFVPDDLLSMPPSEWDIEMFAQVLQVGGTDTLDVFTAFPTELDRVSGTIHATLPAWVLTNYRTADSSYEAIIVIGSVSRFEEDLE